MKDRSKRRGGETFTANTEENIALLKTSWEYSMCKRELLVCTVAIVLAAAIWIGGSFVLQSCFFMLLFIPVLLICLPTFVAVYKRMRDITRNCDDIVLCETVLEDPRPVFNAGVVFSVLIQASNGKRVRAQTNVIATSRGFARPHYETLDNRKALVAYWETTGQVVVVKCL